MPDDREAWRRIREIAEGAYRLHYRDMDSALCPWGFSPDASAFPQAWDYVEAVLEAEPRRDPLTRDSLEARGYS